MGGYGSGNWYRYDTKTTVESCERFTPKQLRTALRRVVIEGRDIDAVVLNWRSSRGTPSNTLAFIERQADDRITLRLKYRTTLRGEMMDRNYLVAMVSTPSNLPGNTGHRWWFICPLSVNGRRCGRRVGTLYQANGWFGCRHCHNLTYTSSNESHQIERMARARAHDMADIPGLSEAALVEALRDMDPERRGLYRMAGSMGRLSKQHERQLAKMEKRGQV